MRGVHLRPVHVQRAQGPRDHAVRRGGRQVQGEHPVAARQLQGQDRRLRLTAGRDDAVRDDRQVRRTARPRYGHRVHTGRSKPREAARRGAAERLRKGLHEPRREQEGTLQPGTRQPCRLGISRTVPTA